MVTDAWWDYFNHTFGNHDLELGRTDGQNVRTDDYLSPDKPIETWTPNTATNLFLNPVFSNGHLDN